MCKQNYQLAFGFPANIDAAKRTKLLNRGLLGQGAFIQIGRTDYLMSGPCENEVIERDNGDFEQAIH